MNKKRFLMDKTKIGNDCIQFGIIDTEEDNYLGEMEKICDLLNEQQELIEELQVSDNMGWERAERFEKKCPKELHNKRMYIKRLEYKVQYFKDENNKLKEQLKEKEEEEKQYAKEILRLNELNKQIDRFHRLQGGY